jgi:hypothetical protein
MGRSERYAWGVIVAALAGAAFVFLAAHCRGVFSLSQLYELLLGEGVLSVTLLIVVWAAGWGFGPRSNRWMARHGIDAGNAGGKPVLTIVPLPHRKGFEIAPSKFRVDGNQRFFHLSGRGPLTNEEWEETCGSQTWQVGVPMVDTVNGSRDGSATVRRSQIRELRYKFGVVRLRASGGVAIGCRVTATVREVTGKGRSQVIGPPRSLGVLTWYSTGMGQKVLGDMRASREILANPADGINDHIERAGEKTVRLNPETERDLQVFYMRAGYPAVFLCGESVGVRAGESENNRVVRFQIDLSMSAENCAEQTRRYLVTARWDDFTWKEIPWINH